VNLVTKDGAHTVVLLSTDLQVLTSAEKVRALEIALWMVDEGWTVMTATDSPLAEVVRQSARALDGSYIELKDEPGMQVIPTRHRMPPWSRLAGGI
ncbi:hypothetical protein, partial [Humibacter sp.]